MRTRLACMVYEGLLLFGPVFGAGWLFSVLTQQRHALFHREGMQAWIFFVIGLYFVWFWSRGRQTLPMKTWRIRLVDRAGKPLSYNRALLRYLLSWLWFLPGLVLAAALGIHTGPLLLWIPAANVVLWALAVYLDPQRQFLHDRLAGTRLLREPAPSTD
ncbi:MAG: RDD family protein [Lacisediminimonas sp.]|nr:RDD family protein [Lacisediminimonas sp.]MDO8300213.1 RDD family protein [Lacisediminimonas sp.]